MKKHLKNWIPFGALSFALTAISSAHAIPKFGTTKLPFHEEMIPYATAEMAKFIATLEVMEDTEDSRKFYYLPKFRSQTIGATGSMLINRKQLARSEKIESIQTSLYGILNGDLLAANTELKLLRIKKAALDLNDESARTILDSMISEVDTRRNAIFAQASANSSTIPKAIQTSFISEILSILGSANVPVTEEMLTNDIPRMNAVGTLNASNGGVVTTSIFAGFTSEEIDLMRSYHLALVKAGYRDVTISVIPVESLKFTSLAEVVGKDQIGISMFRNVKGGGNFSGATVNMDLSLDGASAFASVPPPMFIPIEARATTVLKYPTFRAHLSCNFETGWTVQGRSDVRDGLVIYNNDLTQELISTDVADTKQPCLLTFSDGGGLDRATREAAYRKAMEETVAELTKLYFTRAELARQSKEAFVEEVKASVERNRHSGANTGWGALSSVFGTAGWQGALMFGASQASQFYWHTDQRNVQSISKLKFEKDIVDDTNSNVEVDIPLGVCMAYNPEAKLFFSCSIAEVARASNSSTATSIAKNSDECAHGQMSTDECSRIREIVAPRNPLTGNIDLPANL